MCWADYGLIMLINDLPHLFDSSCVLFADDTVLYRPITTSSNETILQRDLDRMSLNGATATK